MKTVADAAEAFLLSVSAADLENNIITSVDRDCYAELLLVGIVGFAGVLKLSLANRVVPINYPGRCHIITTLFNSDPGSGKKVGN